MASLYERLGGRRVIEKIVCDFYQTILNDEELNVFYLENVSDISLLHHLVADFFIMIFGGPNNYKGRDMYSSHKHMPITAKDYDGVWRHMEMSFRKHGSSELLIKEVKEVIYSFHDQIIPPKK
jgi:hemoglobin